MSENSPIKDALYTEIDDLGQERIHDLLLEGKFSELFEKIYQPSINKIKLMEVPVTTLAPPKLFGAFTVWEFP